MFKLERKIKSNQIKNCRGLSSNKVAIHKNVCRKKEYTNSNNKIIDYKPWKKVKRNPLGIFFWIIFSKTNEQNYQKTQKAVDIVLMEKKEKTALKLLNQDKIRKDLFKYLNLLISDSKNAVSYINNNFRIKINYHIG